MQDILSKVADQILTGFVASVGTGLFWVAKSLWAAKKDLDIAHQKIRALQKELEYLASVIEDFKNSNY